MSVVRPEEFTEEMYLSSSILGLKDFLALVKVGKPWSIATERLLRLNGNSRRGKHVNSQIDEALKNHGLVCKPSIDVADYYGSVVISDPRDELPEPETVVSLPLSAFRGGMPSLIYCGRDMPAPKVQTLMVADDLSQIPVLSSDRKSLHGVVTWKTIAQYSGNLETALASDLMGPRGHVASSSDDFLELVETIIENEFVLYRIPNGQVDGIVTASDLARAFNGTAAIYIQLQEIETRLRILLDRSPIPDLQAHLEPKRRNMKSFRGATDMTFGEYLSALSANDIWQSTGIKFDQATCIKYLETVKDVRNKRMHFSALAAQESEATDTEQESVARVLRILRAVSLR